MNEIKEERVIIDGENKIGATISYIDDNKKKIMKKGRQLMRKMGII